MDSCWEAKFTPMPVHGRRRNVDLPDYPRKGQTARTQYFRRSVGTSRRAHECRTAPPEVASIRQCGHGPPPIDGGNHQVHH